MDIVFPDGAGHYGKDGKTESEPEYPRSRDEYENGGDAKKIAAAIAAPSA